MAITKTGSARWQGGIKDGKGEVSTESGALSGLAYGFNTRFGDTPGTNPEELIGAAHAGCFSMALSNILGEAGFKADELATEAEVTLDKQPDGFAITAVRLTLKAKIPGIDDAKFQELAAKAKAGLPHVELDDLRYCTLDEQKILEKLGLAAGSGAAEQRRTEPAHPQGDAGHRADQRAGDGGQPRRPDAPGGRPYPEDGEHKDLERHHHAR